MKKFFERAGVKIAGETLLVLILLGAAIAFGEYRRHEVLTYLDNTNTALEQEVASSAGKNKELSDSLDGLKTQVASLVDLLGSQQNQSAAFQEQLGQIGATINTLDTLSKIDPELLQKYSKVFFLNEHYSPPLLSMIEPLYVYDKNRSLQFLTPSYSFLSKMLQSAEIAGLHLKIGSSYRSFGTQAALKAQYKVTYGSGANSFSADQGYSEHQLGTTIDFTTDSLHGELEGFDGTPEYNWLVQNAHTYGFVLSYPKTNKYYIYEPWHWRFVGVDLAMRLHREGKYFYDLDQRVIDSYLAVIFN